MKCATLASNHVRAAIYRFERLAAQNSNLVKYGAGGEEVRYWGNGFGTASELSIRHECDPPSAAVFQCLMTRIGVPRTR
jgi:hypothetical protein